MIAVTGATGQLGRLVIEGLKAKGLAGETVAVVRSPEKAKDLGVVARGADYNDLGALTAAFQHIDALLLISSNEVGQRAAQHQNIINAAKAAGVHRIIYTSLLHADTSPLSLAQEHVATEQALKASGIRHVILRNGWYSENYTGSIPGALAGGAFIGSAGEGLISSAARADYAAAAVAVLAAPDRGVSFEGKVIELAGDTAYRLSDLAAEISRQTGRNIPYRDLAAADYAAVLESFGLPAGLALMIAGWDAGVAEGALYHEGSELADLIGRPTTPIADSVKAALAA